MSVFSNKAFDRHEQIVFCNDPESGLEAIIAIHDTTLGPALGGCRMWDYASESDGIYDALRLARGMTYKSALAGLDLGGGKSVIFGNPHSDKTQAKLLAMGRFVDSLGGRYVVAEDVGTSVADLKVMARTCRHAVGVQDKTTGAGTTHSGDPSPATAQGVFTGLKAAVSFQLQRDDLEGVTVAIQGVGNVGYSLAQRLSNAGARLWVSDIHAEALTRAADELGAEIVKPDDIFAQDVDVFAPCALGAVLNDRTIAQLKARIIAGAANNQLAEDRHGQMLLERGILYAPDYAINAGGVIDVASEYKGYSWAQVMHQVEGIHDTLLTIFHRAASERLPTNVVADRLVEARLQRHRRRNALAA